MEKDYIIAAQLLALGLLGILYARRGMENRQLKRQLYQLRSQVEILYAVTHPNPSLSDRTRFNNDVTFIEPRVAWEESETLLQDNSASILSLEKIAGWVFLALVLWGFVHTFGWLLEHEGIR